LRTDARLPERPAGVPSRPRLLAACAAVPPLALTAFVAWTLASAAFGDHPLWHSEPLNMSEAAAARDLATVAAMLERGEDPNLKHAVRPALLESAGEFTPFEAGVISGRLEVVHLLQTHGASVDPRRRFELACEARRRGYTDVADYLAAEAECP
jgi:hypothetical protein